RGRQPSGARGRRRGHRRAPRRPIPSRPMIMSNTPITVLIAEDEPVPRRRLARLLGEEPDVRVVAQCAGGREAVERIREESPDLVFLDVQMPDLNGFQVIEAVGPERMPTVVFVTAFDAYAVRAFEVHAVDYLLM